MIRRIISELQIATNVRFREAYIHIRMTGLGRKRTLNKNLTQINFLTNLTDCCVPSGVIRQRQLYPDEYGGFG